MKYYVSEKELNAEEKYITMNNSLPEMISKHRCFYEVEPQTTVYCGTVNKEDVLKSKYFQVSNITLFELLIEGISMYLAETVAEELLCLAVRYDKRELFAQLCEEIEDDEHNPFDIAFKHVCRMERSDFKNFAMTKWGSYACHKLEGTM